MPERAISPSGAPLTRRQIREAERLRAGRATADATGMAPDAIGTGPSAPADSSPADCSPADSAPADCSPADSAATPTAGVPARRRRAELRRASETATTAPQAEAPASEAPASDGGADESPVEEAASVASEDVADARSERPGLAAAAPASRAQRRRADGRRTDRPERRRTLTAFSMPRWLPRAAVLGVLGATTVVAPIAAFATPDTPEPTADPTVSTLSLEESALELIDAAAARTGVETAGATAAIMADATAPGRALVQTSRSMDREAPACALLEGGANGARAALAGTTVVEPLAGGSYSQSSAYGFRVHPINGSWTKHEGLDFSAPLGTPIYSVADGTVVHAGNGLDGRSSMLVIVQHEIDGVTYYSWYVHMYPDGVFVEQGQQVRAGDVIGEVGNNGNSTGPHLHLEIHLDTEGTTMDPGVFLEQHGAISLQPGACAR